ncbi:MAG: hypothetical protein L3J52_04065, partial [Proteobacteria bacterium]|nr:hypothetical protein [Pseudomonadota bacterium]
KPNHQNKPDQNQAKTIQTKETVVKTKIKNTSGQQKNQKKPKSIHGKNRTSQKPQQKPQQQQQQKPAVEKPVISEGLNPGRMNRPLGSVANLVAKKQPIVPSGAKPDNITPNTDSSPATSKANNTEQLKTQTTSIKPVPNNTQADKVVKTTEQQKPTNKKPVTKKSEKKTPTKVNPTETKQLKKNPIEKNSNDAVNSKSTNSEPIVKTPVKKTKEAVKKLTDSKPEAKKALDKKPLNNNVIDN